MNNREKVFKGLECAITHKVPCEECPYMESGYYCLRNVAKDASALLKDQERIINELEEKLRLMEYGDQDILQSGLMPAT